MIFNWIQYSQQSALLRRIVDRIRNSLELKVVLQTAVDEVATLLGLDCCVFFWYFDDTQRVQVVCERVCRAQRPSQLGYYPLEAFGSAAPVLAQGGLIVSGEVAGPPVLRSIARRLSRLQKEPLPKGHRIFGTETNLLIPVVGQEGSIGYLTCLSDEARSWSTAEIEFIQSIAQQLEIAIRQARLYEQTQRQAQREQLVNQITTQTRQSFDFEIILTQAIAQLLEGLQADRCLVHLVEDISDIRSPEQGAERRIATPHGAALRHQHLYEVCREPFPPSIDDFDVNGPMTQWVIQHRQSVVMSDVTQDQRIGPHNEEYQKAQIQSSLVVPVQANGTLHAILYLNQCSHNRYWSSNDQQLVQAVADQLAISLEQAHLYAKTQRQALESAAQAQYLAKTLQELRLTQAQLIQSEKLSSLGCMVAGVAHEINNPVSFIYGNLPYIEKYLESLIQLLKAYQTQYPQPTAEIQALTEDIELDFLVKDLFQILNSIGSGADRIRRIVLSLRNFSRLDEASRKTVDIHEGIESTLSILQDQLQEGIQVIRRYADLPAVECYPRLLNQVFMNLILNAIEALNRSSASSKVIIIRTELLTNERTGEARVRVTITDNGPGIALEIQSRIFDPFFTTKEIGQGTGLGLTVSYQTIVNQHRGQLVCQSQPGAGAEFILEIPLKHSQRLSRTERLDLSAVVSELSQVAEATNK